MDGPAKEPVHRLAKRLADDVPARHVQDRERGHRDLSGTRVVIADHAAGERFEGEGIRADNVCRNGFFEVAEERAGVVDHADLADALESIVSPHDDEGEVAPRVAEHERPDFGDLHPLSPVVTMPRTMNRFAAAKNAMRGST